MLLKRSQQKEYYYWSFVMVFVAFVVVITFLRLTELIALCSNSFHGLMILAVIGGILSLILKPPSTFLGSTRRYLLLFMVIWQLKKEMDGDLSKSIKLKDLTGSICLITGGNSGVGMGIAEQLLGLNCHVVLACRSLEKCNTAADQLREQDDILTKKAGPSPKLSNPKVYMKGQGLITTMVLDLNDLNSVKEFTNQFKRKFNKLDVLINNAGLIANKGDRTVQGLETSIGVMYVGHFALTKWLKDLLLKPVSGSDEPSRVINIASAAYVAGAFHSSLFLENGFGDFKGEYVDNCGTIGPFNLISCCPALRCPNTNGYSRAKLANILHAQELQRRSDLQALKKNNRMLLAYSLHPGVVTTNIHPFLSSKLMGLILRSSYDAAFVALHAILSDNIIPGAYIDSMKKSHDLQDFRVNRLDTHLKAFPHANKYAYVLKTPTTTNSLTLQLWKSLKITFNNNDNTIPNKNSTDVAIRLYDVTEKIISNWESGKKFIYIGHDEDSTIRKEDKSLERITVKKIH